MTSTMQSWLKKGASLFNSSTPSICSTPEDTIAPPRSTRDFQNAPESDRLFRRTDPAIDGEDCLHDCASCTVRFPAKFEVDMKDKLYGNVNGWATHLLVATGKTDWVRDVADERGSLMEAIEKGGIVPSNGKLKLSASNMPVPDEYHDHEPGEQPTSVLILPGFTIVDRVTPALTPDLIKHFVNPSVTTMTPLGCNSPEPIPDESSESETGEDHHPQQQQQQQQQEQQEEEQQKISTPLHSRSCPHAAVILLCSQRTRDVRCGQSAPLLRREFERHLRPLGLYRELDDERPGGVGIYFVSHVGGHKYAANVIVYRRRDFDWYRKDAATASAPAENESDTNPGQEGEREKEEQKDEGASQGIWLARVRPEDCENIIRYTVLQGKVVKPGHQLRGGFDREKGLISW